MSTFLAKTSLNIDNTPTNIDTRAYIRVRIPSIHGNPENLNGEQFLLDSQLPWALVVKPIDFVGQFDAHTYFDEGTVCLVEMLNNDLNNLIVVGKTTGGVGMSQGIDYTPNCTNSSYSDLMVVVSNEVKQPPISDNGTNVVKYNVEFYNGVQKNYGSWGTVFIWWCFNHSYTQLLNEPADWKTQWKSYYKKENGIYTKLNGFNAPTFEPETFFENNSKYFYGGNKTASVTALKQYHEKHKDSITSDYQKGDVVYFSSRADKVVTHAAIVDYISSDGKKVTTIDGNTQAGEYNLSDYGYVLRRTRDYDKIIGGFRPGMSFGVSSSWDGVITTKMRAIQQAAFNHQSTKPATGGYCAAWVSGVYEYAGYGYIGGNAIDMWNKFCHTSFASTDDTNIPIGAVVCGSGSHGRGETDMGALYGHVGIYVGKISGVGDRCVIDNIGGVRESTLEHWKKGNTSTCQGHKGWIGWVFPDGYN